MVSVNTAKNNLAYVTYSLEGIPTDGMFPLYQGYTRKNKIIIQPHLSGDRGLLSHELTHVDQWYQYKFFNTRYRFSKKFRLAMESEAFAAQLFSDGDTLKSTEYARELCSGSYNLNIPINRALSCINKHYLRMVKNV